MKGFGVRAVTAALAAAFAGVLAPACAHDDATIFIRHVMAPPTTSGGGACVFQADPTQPYLTSGVVDAALTGSYAAELLVGNQLLARGSSDNVRVETSRFTVKDAIVRLVDPADGSTIMNNTIPTSGTIDPSSGSTPSWAVIDAQMMDSAAIAHFNPGAIAAPSRLAIANVTVRGTTLGGQDEESNEFAFPIYVCYGCLVTIPAGAATSKYCSGSGASVSSTAAAVPCVVGNNQPIDCSLCYPNAVCDPTKR